jgi:hypothetical protein
MYASRHFWKFLTALELPGSTSLHSIQKTMVNSLLQRAQKCALNTGKNWLTHGIGAGGDSNGRKKGKSAHTRISQPGIENLKSSNEIAASIKYIKAACGKIGVILFESHCGFFMQLPHRALWESQVHSRWNCHVSHTPKWLWREQACNASKQEHNGDLYALKFR